MLAPTYEATAVQAFPISLNTAKGTFTDESCVNRSVLHCNVDCSVTYTFTDDSTYVETLVAGEDRGLTRDVKSLTTTGTCLISQTDSASTDRV